MSEDAVHADNIRQVETPLNIYGEAHIMSPARILMSTLATLDGPQDLLTRLMVIILPNA